MINIYEVYLVSSNINDKPLFEAAGGIIPYSKGDIIMNDDKWYTIVNIVHKVINMYDVVHYILVKEVS